MSNDIGQQIHEIVDRETRAWDNQDVDLVLSIFHPDFVWPFPAHAEHDPLEWVTGMGRFNESRWRDVYTEHFATYQLVHNNRKTLRVDVTVEQDGAFAVVDVDTLWRDRATGADFHWLGRACKVYSLVDGAWKMISHVGLLRYPAADPGHSADSTTVQRTPSDIGGRGRISASPEPPSTGTSAAR